jgi:malate synthase
MAEEVNTTTLRPGIDNLEHELLEQLETTNACRETLHQQMYEDEGLAIIRAEFNDMLKDFDTLYKEILELIMKIRDLRAYRNNYHKQLQEAK